MWETKGKRKFPLLYEVYTLSDQSHEYNWLAHPGSLSGTNDLFPYYEGLFQKVDPENWEILSKKLAKYLCGSKNGSKVGIVGKKEKQDVKPKYPSFQCLNYFNEVHGYLFLKNDLGCNTITFLEETNVKSPDLKAFKGQNQFVLDVKTINQSDDQQAHGERVVRPIDDLDYLKPDNDVINGLMDKIKGDIERAMKQFENFPDAQKIIFLVINPDYGVNILNVRKTILDCKKELMQKEEGLKICGIFQPLGRPQIIVEPL